MPVPVAPIAPLFRGLIAHVSGYEELAADAALRGGRSRVAAALLAHALTRAVRPWPPRWPTG